MMGCENENLVRTLQHGGDIYQVFGESLDFEEAVDKCKCPSIPSRTLALVKTKEAFNNLSQELSKLEKPPYWRVGLKQEGSAYRWLDGEILETLPEYYRAGTGDCFTIYATGQNAFLRPLQCKGWASHSGIFGYICSYNNETFPAKITGTTPNPISADGGDISQTPTEPNLNVLIWITLALLFSCVIVLALLLLKRRQRNSAEKEPNSTAPVMGNDDSYSRENSVEYGRHGYNQEQEYEEVDYVEMDDLKIVNTEGTRSTYDITYSEIVPESNTKDVYAVVNKKKSLVNNTTQQQKSEAQAFYSVVDKTKKRPH